MSNNDLNDDAPVPTGDLALQTVAMPADTNASGDIFGGWLVSQMDLAGAIAALKVARGRIATVAINGMVFLTPVHVGAVVSCYADIKEVGRSSVKVNVEVWVQHKTTQQPTKVTDGEFVFVAIDDSGKTRAVT
ncbi:acyl-CoA thioesterase [uncultured Oceanicoccus sp.]|uniref:acyl-CoA thioesterase n=1 Tax=uncultured Oceanicoccus sp. TaxID=1706381 RepID=UPI0030DB7A30